MDEVLASGMAKLAKTEHPIAVPRHKYTLPGMRDEAVRLERALTQGEDILVQGTLGLPAFLPLWAKRATLWLARPFLNKRVINRLAAPNVVRAKMDELQASIKSLDREMVEGILTPLTLADDAEIHAYYYKTRRHVESTLAQEITLEGQKAREEAIEFTSNAYHLAKRVECALKKAEPRNGPLQLAQPMRMAQPVTRALTAAQAHKIDPRINAEIWIEYRQAFELSEDELGKS